MGIGLTFDEYVDLRLRVPAGADHAFHEAAQMEREQMFPMNTAGASSHLRSRGYDCRPQMLDLLIENGVAKLSKPDVWTQADVEAAAEHLEDCDILTPYAAMCETLGCRYADFLRPLKEASKHESQKYGRRIPADDQYFIMHRVPPRGVLNADGQLVGSNPAVISFTLCDDSIGAAEKQVVGGDCAGDCALPHVSRRQSRLRQDNGKLSIGRSLDARSH